MADIEQVELNYETYKTQLSAVTSALSAAPGDEELITLQTDLTELITITENELLNLKKNQLLLSLREPEKPDENSDDDENSIDSFVGTKCSIEYTSAWGTVQQQNCIILSVDISDDSETVVKVLFLTPSSKEMLPCKHYLNSTCNFDKCKYSHGYEVTISSLKDYVEPNFDNFVRGKRCLCKNEDELWVPGTVTSVKTDKIYIKLDGSGTEVDCVYENVFPLQGVDGDSESDTELNISDLSEEEYQPFETSTPNMHFGSWEEHTNSFGSKMLFKMGYKLGSGLGPRGDGIVEPIEADIIPPGVSLDTVRELREKRLIRTVNKLNSILKKKADQRTQSDLTKTQKSQSMFAMMDNMFKARGSKQKQRPKNKKPINKVSEKTVRVKSVSIENDIGRCRRRIAELKKSLTRNRQDSGHCSRVKGQIEAESKKLDGLLSRQRSVENELKMRTDKKKLKIF